MKTILISTIGPFLAAWLITQIANTIKGWLKAREDKIEKEAYEVLMAGTATVQNNFIREAKVAAGDGKLSKEEVKRFEKIAFDYAIDLAKSPAVLLYLTKLTTGAISAWIKTILANGKRKK